jgi:hypothetical protein
MLETYPYRLTALQWFFILVFCGAVIFYEAGRWLVIQERFIFYEARIAEMQAENKKIMRNYQRMVDLLRLEAELPEKLKKKEMGI